MQHPMPDTEARAQFRRAVWKEVGEIARAGEISGAGQRAVQAVAEKIADTMPEGSDDWGDTGADMLLELAETDWPAATHALASVFLAGLTATIEEVIAEERA